MKKITAYQTDDGRTFDNPSDAAIHELVRELAPLFSADGWDRERSKSAALTIARNAHVVSGIVGKATKSITAPTAEEPLP